MRFRWDPPRSPNCQWPISIWPLVLIIYSTFFYNSVVRISPAVFLQLGFLSYSFIISILACSFNKLSLILAMSPAILFYCCLIYSLMNLSLYLKTTSTICKTFSLIFLNSLLKVLLRVVLKLSILKFILAIYVANLPDKLSRHWIDSSLADSKVWVWATRPAHIWFSRLSEGREAFDRLPS